MEGLTGKIRFDTLGFRSDFHLDIVELKKEGLVKVGTWNHGAGVNFTRNYTESYSEIVESLHNKTLKITTILVSIFPFFPFSLFFPSKPIFLNGPILTQSEIGSIKFAKQNIENYHHFGKNSFFLKKICSKFLDPI